MFSISSGLMSITRLDEVVADDRDPSNAELPPTDVELSYMMPSTTNSGWLSRVSESDVPPRSIICAPAPAAPDDCVMFTPAILPERELSALAVLFFMSSSAAMSSMAYPSDFLSLRTPIAVTTTSSRFVASGCSVTTMPSDAAASIVWYPI